MAKFPMQRFLTFSILTFSILAFSILAFMLLISPSPAFAAKACKDEGLVLQKLKQRVAEYGVAELNKKGGQFGETMLTAGIRLGCSNMAKYIIEQKPDLDIKNNKGYTALMVALAKKDFKLAKLLVEYGADVNLKNHYGITPLVVAVGLQSEKAVKLLLENGSSTKVKMGQDDIFEIAEQFGNNQIIALLKKYSHK